MVMETFSIDLHKLKMIISVLVCGCFCELHSLELEDDTCKQTLTRTFLMGKARNCNEQYSEAAVQFCCDSAIQWNSMGIKLCNIVNASKPQHETYNFSFFPALMRTVTIHSCLLN